MGSKGFMLLAIFCLLLAATPCKGHWYDFLRNGFTPNRPLEPGEVYKNDKHSYNTIINETAKYNQMLYATLLNDTTNYDTMLNNTDKYLTLLNATANYNIMTLINNTVAKYNTMLETSNEATMLQKNPGAVLNDTAKSDMIVNALATYATLVNGTASDTTKYDTMLKDSEKYETLMKATTQYNMMLYNVIKNATTHEAMLSEGKV